MTIQKDKLAKNLELLEKRKENAILKEKELNLIKEEKFLNTFTEATIKRDFIHDNYFKNLGILLFTFLTLASAILYSSYSYFVYEPPAKFLATDEERRVLEEIPLLEDVMPEENLNQWANEQLVKIFTYNHISFPKHGGTIKPAFSENGYRDFIAAFNELRLQTKVTEQKAIVEPILVQPLKVKNDGSVAGNTRKAWMLEGVVVLNLHGANGKEMYKYNASILLIRSTFKENKNGITIEKVQLFN
jgi:hypothetical protein